MFPVRPCSLPFKLETLLLHGAVAAVLLSGLGAAWPAGSHAQPTSSSRDAARPQASETDSVRSRRAALRSARARSAERLRAPAPSSLRRLFLWAEENQLFRQLTGVANQKIRILPGGLGRGSGAALRLVYVPFPERDDLDVRLSAGGSALGYWQFVGSVGYRSESWFSYAYSQVQQRPETTYLAFEDVSGAGESLTVDVTSWASGGVVGWRLLPSLSIAAGAAYLRSSTGVTAAEPTPTDAEVLNPGASTRYATIGGHLTLDLRDVRYERDFGTRYIPLEEELTDRPLNPDRGTLLSLDYTRFRELGDPDASFSQVEVEAQQYVSLLNGYHTFALRHRSTFTEPDAGAAVPFYRLPYVGGNFTLRGYDEFRFQGGPHALLYNLEYRYKVWHHADMVLFGDAGKVFRQVDQWGLTNLRYSYGAEVRFTTARHTLLRFGVAFDESWDPRLVFEFNNIF